MENEDFVLKKKILTLLYGMSVNKIINMVFKINNKW